MKIIRTMVVEKIEVKKYAGREMSGKEPPKATKRRKENVPDLRKNEKGPCPVHYWKNESTYIAFPASTFEAVFSSCGCNRPRRVRRRAWHEESPWSNPLSCWEGCCNS
jgi:hypothetical protein